MPAFLPIVSKFDSTGVDKAQSSLKNFSKIAGGIALGAAAAVAGIAAVGIRDFAKFDEALNKSLSIMGGVSEALETEMANTAREVAKSTTFSAEEAAESFFFLASAGLDAQQQIAAMPQVAKFAQAGLFDMATATDLATDAQSALGLTSDDAAENLEGLTRVTDVFVKANTLANTSVEQLAAAITSKAGNALKTVGKDIEEGSAALAVFADQGIKGEMAGTLLTNTLFGLSDQAKKVPGEFERLGISVFDADGKMNNLADIARDVTGALDGMSTEQKLAELSNLGFSKQARQGILALVDNGDALADYETALRDAGGTAEEVANNQLQTPTAQFGLFRAAIDDAVLGIGGALTPALGNMAAALTPLLNDVLPKIEQLLTNKVSPALETFAAFVERIVFSIQDQGLDVGMERLFGGIGEAVSGIFSGENVENFAAGLEEFRMSLFDGALKLITALVEGLVENLPMIVTFITDELLPTFLENFTTIFNELITLAMTLFPMIVSALVEVVPDLITAITEILPQIVETLTGMIPGLLEVGIELFLALVTAVVEILPDLLTQILDMLPSIIESIISMLPAIIEGAIELFNGLIGGLIEVIPDLLTAILDALPDIIIAIMEMLPDIILAAMDLFTGLITGLIDATPEILTAITELIPQITSELLDPDNMLKMIDAGIELVKGIALGITQNAPRILGSAARSMGSIISNAFKSRMGIESPSKVFAGFGGELVEGLSMGLADGKSLLAKSSVDMASTVMFSAEDTLTAGMSIPGGAGNQSQSVINITINTGVGSDPVATGRAVVDAIKRYEATSGKVFVSA